MSKKKMLFSIPTGLLTDLVAYYAFQGNANDSVGGKNGTILNTPTFTTGINGNAINFGNDATLRYVDIPDNNDFSFTNGTTDVPFTISLWVNLTTPSLTGSWFINKRGTTSGSDEWQFMFLGNRVQFWKFQFNNNSIYQRIATDVNILPLNTWTHFVYTDNGSGAVGSGKMYRNGTLDVNINQNVGGTYTRMNNGNNLTRVGQSSWAPAFETLKHRGLIDELAIWKNRELTATEVAELYNTGTGKFYPF